jgi:sialidase-1
LSGKVDARVLTIETLAGRIVPKDETPKVAKRISIALRRHWDDGVHTYRIPALATSEKGTLLAVYDMRRRRGKDLQEDIDIGLLRSTDGGRTWGAQQVIMDMGTFGGNPQEVNGVSDPGIIVDPKTGEIFVFGVWMHLKPGTYNLTTKQPLKIGFGQHDYFNGKMRDVRLYNRALTATDVAKVLVVDKSNQ